MIEEFNDFAKGNVEAVVAAGRAAAKGAETLGQNAAEYSRKSFEEATKAMKTLSGAKSPTEFFKLQNDFAKTQFDSLIRSEEHTSELQSLMRISYAVFCLKKKTTKSATSTPIQHHNNNRNT